MRQQTSFCTSPFAFYFHAFLHSKLTFDFRVLQRSFLFVLIPYKKFSWETSKISRALQHFSQTAISQTANHWTIFRYIYIYVYIYTYVYGVLEKQMGIQTNRRSQSFLLHFTNMDSTIHDLPIVSTIWYISLCRKKILCPTCVFFLPSLLRLQPFLEGWKFCVFCLLTSSHITSVWGTLGSGNASQKWRNADGFRG